MSFTLNIFTGIIGLIAVLVIVGFIVYKSNKSQKDSELPPLVVNFMPDYTGGHAFLRADKIEEGTDLVVMDCFPFDWNYHKLENDKEKPTSYKLIVKKEQFEEVGLSKHRRTIFVYPNLPEELPNNTKKAKIGKILMGVIEENDLVATETKHQRKRIEILNKIRDDSLQIPVEAINEIREYKVDTMNAFKEKPKEDK